MGKHRAAIVGCGRMGTEHGRAYAARPDVDLVAIADSDPENLAAFGDRFGVPGRARYADYLSGGLQSLLDAVEHGGEPLTSGDDMRRVLEIAIALRESARRPGALLFAHRRPEPEDHPPPPPLARRQARRGR